MSPASRLVAPVVLFGVALAGAGAAWSAARSYELPEETAAFAEGPNVDAALENCTGCHSADYIITQPRDLPDPRAFWTAEVTKMQHAYAAPIADADVPAIVDYLVQTYGKSQP
ncbi:MAG: cytochrome c [Geminicoccaceae bacterium]